MTIFTHYSVNSATMWLFMSILTHINVHIQTTFLDCLLTAFPRYYHLKTGWQCGLYNPENDSSVVGSSLLWAHIVWFLPNSKQNASSLSSWHAEYKIEESQVCTHHIHTTLLSLSPVSPVFFSLSHVLCLPAAGSTQCPQESPGKSTKFMKSLKNWLCFWSLSSLASPISADTRLGCFLI